MPKTILITGSTDGIGLAAAKVLSAQGHHILLHGRNPEKLQAVRKHLAGTPNSGMLESYLADLSCMAEVEQLGRQLKARHTRIDVVINNAGIFRSSDTPTRDGLDVRFAVNTFAPYLLTRRLLPALAPAGRVINVSSAAQSPVALDVLSGSTRPVDPFDAYAQSKLALTLWNNVMALAHKDTGLVFVALNPGSLLGTKMVREGFGMTGKDIGIGSDILVNAATSPAFAMASGRYYDNDKGRFSAPHPDALDPYKQEQVIAAIEAVLGKLRLAE